MVCITAGIPSAARAFDSGALYGEIPFANARRSSGRDRQLEVD